MPNPSPPYHLSVLPNQLRVLTVPMRDRESAAVAIWVKVGGRYEPKKLSGISHFLEHMLFKGTKKRNSRQIKREVEGVGGILNAFTAEEATCYFAKLLVQHFPRALDVLSDMVKEATLLEHELEKERPVILEEIKMYRDQPAQHVQELMSELLWPDHPLGRNLAGTPETVSGIRRADMMNYKKKYYHPKNVLISVSGPVSHAEVEAMARKCFPGTADGAVSQFQAVQARQRTPRYQFVEKETEQTHLVIGFHGFSRRDKRRYALGVLSVLLGGNMSSRLFEEVREKRGLAYEIRSSIGHYQDTGSVTISAGTETRKARLTVGVVLQELEKLIRKSVPEEELKRAKDYYTSQFLMGLEDTLDHLLWVGEKILYYEDPPRREEILRQIQGVTAKDVQEVAREIFQTSRFNLTLIGPVKEKEQEKIRKTVQSNEI